LILGSSARAVGGPAHRVLATSLSGVTLWPAESKACLTQFFDRIEETVRQWFHCPCFEVSVTAAGGQTRVVYGMKGFHEYLLYEGTQRVWTFVPFDSLYTKCLSNIERGGEGNAAGRVVVGCERNSCHRSQLAAQTPSVAITSLKSRNRLLFQQTDAHCASNASFSKFLLSPQPPTVPL